MSTDGIDAPPAIDDALVRQLDCLGDVVEVSRGRLPAEVVDPAQSLTAHASDRLRLAGDHTIVALAGATGSGKSSLFNALTDLEVAGCSRAASAMA